VQKAPAVCFHLFHHTNRLILRRYQYNFLWVHSISFNRFLTLALITIKGLVIIGNPHPLLQYIPRLNSFYLFKQR
jgi:hypothetical protein